ncbi:MAG: tRNA 2-thiouridine(34) synthase MnmA [Deltaproteobacteria bacterium]|nr:tRNA 2-thiouridine(34) synthase MnmA [Deltaproteobacteria bacterium]
MSGGVDSAVAALLLKEAGYEVVGLTLALGWGPDAAPAAAARVARELGVAHEVVPAAEPFRRLVLAPTARAYHQGLTPNPCAWCNARVKFPRLWARAASLGCQALATGHYARLASGADGGKGLVEGADPAKGQAYFLARLGPRFLSRVRFPLGELTKEAVRERARQAGLGAVERPESQDLCFLPPGGWQAFMTSFGPPRPGVVEDERGRVLAAHQGLHRFTVGQRRGLGVALGYPAYVVALDGPRAAVKVGPRSSLARRGLVGRQPRWFTDPGSAPELKVKIRYSHPGESCRVEPHPRGVTVMFTREQAGVAPGQLAVFYDEDRVVGSAWIDKPIS